MSNNLQTTYKKFYSTESALLKVENDVLLNMEKVRVIALTLLDLSAVFDTIDHLTLISRLSSRYGILLQLLTGLHRTWATNVNMYKFRIIFLMRFIYILVYPGLCPWTYTFHPIYASLNHIIAEHDLEHHLYVDDTQIYISLSGSEALESLTDLTSCVSNVFTCMTNSKLNLNPSKTKFIINGSRNQRGKFKDLFPILLLNHATLPKAFVRNLGFIFYCDFNFKRQIYQICQILCYITSVTFGVLGSTLAQKLQNLLHVLQLLVILTIVTPFCTIFLTGTFKDCSGYKIVWHV